MLCLGRARLLNGHAALVQCFTISKSPAWQALMDHANKYAKTDLGISICSHMLLPFLNFACALLVVQFQALAGNSVPLALSDSHEG